MRTNDIVPWDGTYQTDPTRLPVFEYQSVLVADSRDVAPFVEKEHKDLLRAIRRYVKVIDKSLSAILRSVDFFIPATYTDPTGRTLPCFYCTEKGCAMIANKMTGDRGIIFTALFVEAFYEMRERLRNGPVWTDEPAELYSEDSDCGMGAYSAGYKQTEAQKLKVRRRIALDEERHREKLRALCVQDMSCFSWWKGNT